MTNTSSLKERKRSMYPYHMSYRTRWTDNDQYAHLNNSIYYHLFDSIVNDYLIRYCGLSPTTSPYIGLMVHSSCDYFSALAYPAELDIGMRVKRLGKSSATFEVAAFEGEDENASVAAVGELVHVYVDSKSRKPTKEGMGQQMRQALDDLANKQAMI